MRDTLWAFGVSTAEVLRFGYCLWWWRLRWAVWWEYRRFDIGSLLEKYEARRSEEYSYGETPTATLARILELANLPSGSSFLDLGSGRGVSVMAASFMGFQAFGLELIDEYVRFSHRVARRLNLQVDIRQADILRDDWPQTDILHLNSTAFPFDFRENLMERLQDLEVESLVSTFDWELNTSNFETLQTLRLPVTRGTVLWRLYRKLT